MNRGVLGTPRPEKGSQVTLSVVTRSDTESSLPEEVLGVSVMAPTTYRVESPVVSQLQTH